MIDDPDMLKRFMKTQELVNDIRDYLVDCDLKDPLWLTKTGTMTFHWANWDTTCNLQKEIVKQKVSARNRLAELNNLLAVLKEIDVYIRSKKTNGQISLYDLYEGFLDSRIRMTWFSSEDEVLVSTHHQAGPYVTISSMKWFNKDIYAAFMYRKILTHDIPYRTFRLGLDLHVSCRYDGSPLKSSTITIHQINDYGVLLKFEGESNLTKLTNSEELVLFVDLEPFRKSKNKKYDKVIEHMAERSDDTERLERIVIESNVIGKYGNLDNIQASNASEFFLYVPFYEIHHNQYDTEELKSLFLGVLEKVRDHFEKQIKKIA